LNWTTFASMKWREEGREEIVSAVCSKEDCETSERKELEAKMPDKELDLSGDISRLKDQKFKIKEGIGYKIRIDFIVQREIVHGLKYVQKTTRKGIPVDTMTHMVGSYAPKHEIQSYTTPQEEAPSGMLFRGDYSVNSHFTDDDKNTHLKWDWKFEISKDWWSRSENQQRTEPIENFYQIKKKLQ